MAKWYDWLTRGPVLNAYKRSNDKKKRRSRRERKEVSKQNKMISKANKEAYKQYKIGNKRNEEAYGLQKKLFNRNLKQLEKTGSEKFLRKNALTGKQRNLLDFITDAAKNRTPIKDLTTGSLYKEGKSNLKKLMADQGIDVTQNPLYQSATGNLQDLLSNNPDAYERFKAPAMSEFEREIAPGIAQRFANEGGIRSSGFQNALADAGGQLGLRLGSLRAQLQQSALDRALGYANAPVENQQRQNQLRQGAIGQGLSYAQQPIANQFAQQEGERAETQQALGTNPYLNIYRPPTYGTGEISGGGQSFQLQNRQEMPQRQPGVLGQILGGIAPALGAGIGTAVGGPIGGAIGAGIGGAGSSFFNNQGQYQQPQASSYLPPRQNWGMNQLSRMRP
jgi:hypothetical protein